MLRKSLASITGRSRSGLRGIGLAGMEEVLSHKKGGRGQAPFLSQQQELSLVEEVRSGRLATAGEIRKWIESSYGVSYKVGSVYTLLARLGCSPGSLTPGEGQRRR